MSTPLITDLVWWFTGRPFWAAVSLWLVAAGVVTGLVAAVLGLIDFITIDQVRQHSAGWTHLFTASASILVATANWLVRIGSEEAAILPWGLMLSAVMAALVGAAGWYGGELPYRHKVGVVGHD